MTTDSYYRSMGMILVSEKENYVLHIDELETESKSDGQKYWVALQAIGGDFFIVDEEELKEIYNLIRDGLDKIND